MAEPPSIQDIAWSTTACDRSVGGGGGPSSGGRAQEEEGRRASAEGALDAPGEAGRLDKWEGGRGTTLATTKQDYIHAGGRAAPSMEEGAYLQGFNPSRAHMSLQVVYGYFLYHNNGTHLAGGVPDDAVWKSRWRRIFAQSPS